MTVGKQLRETHKLRNRLSLNKLTIAGSDMSDYADIIRDELNVKNVEFTPNVNDVADSSVYLITPKIGARLGGKLKEIMTASKQPGIDPSQWDLNDDAYEFRLTVKPDVNGAALPDNTAVVVLDTELNSELIAEGLANDALRFIQDTRKTTGMDVSDRIRMEYSADPALTNAIEQHRDRIMADALIVDIVRGSGDNETQIEGYNLAITLTRA